MASGEVLRQQQADAALEEVKSLRLELDKQAIQVEYLREYQKVLSDLQDVKHDISVKWNYVRIAGALGGLLLTVLGVFGLRNLSDISKTVNHAIARDVENQRRFYGDLMAGTALTIQKNYTAAIPKLRKCFDEKPYDKSVLIPLLESINLTDDWLEAEPVLKKLHSDERQFDGINDATVYRVIGAIEVQSGLSLRSRGMAKDGSERMNQGLDILRKAMELTAPNDFDTRVHILNNLWIYHIANDRAQEALQDVQAIERLPDDARVYSWSNMKNWQCMKDLATAKDPKSMKDLQIAAQQWKALEKRYRQE